MVLSVNKISAQTQSKRSDWVQASFQDKNPLHLVNIGDADLGVRYKKGEGTPIVFVHGSWDDHHSWIHVAEILSTKINNPIVLYDRRGHSASTPDKEQGTISQDVSDLVLLTEKLGFRKAHFIGHSYGANIVVKLATDHPEIAESIVLYEPPMFGVLKDKPEYKTEMQQVKKAMTTSKSLLEKGAIQEGTIQFIEKVAFGENSWKEVFDDRARSTMLASYRTWLDQSNDPERLNIHPERLNYFQGSITLIVGTNSIPVYPAVANELKNKMEKIQVKSISGAGHGGLISHVNETAEAILLSLKSDK
ncbi:Alpha/beta hydrolase fold [Sphingobacterium sp. JB170]|nr:Alpha/beta hydrolase fold [Sphingobacterium sp. JB170]